MENYNYLENVEIVILYLIEKKYCNIYKCHLLLMGDYV